MKKKELPLIDWYIWTHFANLEFLNIQLSYIALHDISQTSYLLDVTCFIICCNWFTDNMDTSQILDPSKLTRVGELLGVRLSELLNALTAKTIFVHRGSVVTFLLFFFCVCSNKVEYLKPIIESID